ncbi:inositol hexakisphosphate kinase 3 [Nematostella vectensis]|uniref:inositol hexakisphosphate kinase 3 n=1 Tax=Nematostella vectensis TaxID=45351 RepID=UPI0020775D05|nr:inositol hexakisphosphate kinase 3 [Nematostella vectensis]
MQSETVLDSDPLKCGDSTESGSRVLEPYNNQVGGRSLILNYDRSTLCKPMIPQERQFYEDLPSQLLSFTPKYKGVIHVGCHTREDGQIQLVAYPKNSSVNLPDLNSNNSFMKTVRFISEHESDEDIANIHAKGPLTMETPATTVNPWTFHCQYLHLQRLHESWQAENKLQEFILMENIARDIAHPSIMDLKMGNEGHSDYSDEEKQERQRAKCDASTSKSLGVRIAGMQVYKPALQKYTYRNKYYGFDLTKEGFKEELLQFVHDGHRVRKELLPFFIEKLQLLYRSIDSLDGSRFYSSSLLLIYDSTVQNGGLNGSTALNDSYSNEFKVDIRMIDFGRSFHQGTKRQNTTGPDRGYLLGIESLIKLFSEIALEGNNR